MTIGVTLCGGTDMEKQSLDPNHDALLVHALAMIVMGERGRFDHSRERLEANCGNGVGISIGTVAANGVDCNWLSVTDDAREVLAVSWLPDESEMAVGGYLPGPWEDRLFNVAKPHLDRSKRQHWKKRQRQRGKGWWPFR